MLPSAATLGQVQPPPRNDETRPRGGSSASSRQPLGVFFALAFAISWLPYPFYVLGVLPRPLFLPFGPLVAAVTVIAITEGKRGLTDAGIADVAVAGSLVVVGGRGGPSVGCAGHLHRPHRASVGRVDRVLVRCVVAQCCGRLRPPHGQPAERADG